MKRSLLTITAFLFLAFFISLSQPFISRASAVTPKTALIYGDSLTWESSPDAKKLFDAKSGWTAYFHPFPATAPCQWNNWLPQDLATYSPSVVSITTAGNAYSSAFPCMVDPNGNPLTIGSDAYYAKYTADLNTFFATVTATGAKVVFFKAPPMLDATRNAAVIKIANIATQLAANYHGVSIAGNIRNALAKNGKYTAYKPCLTTESTQPDCVNGVIPIRTIVGSQTGLHLCPGGLPTVYPYFCPTYSSGEYRFAKALVNTTVNPPAPILP